MWPDLFRFQQDRRYKLGMEMIRFCWDKTLAQHPLPIFVRLLAEPCHEINIKMFRLMRSETSSRQCEDKFYGKSVTIKLQFLLVAPLMAVWKFPFPSHLIYLFFCSRLCEEWDNIDWLQGGRGVCHLQTTLQTCSR